VVVKLKKVGSEKSFEQAFTVFYNTIKDKNPNGMSLMELEQACWIELPNLPPIDFYTACEAARRLNLLSEDGHLVARN
jgi:hypothetical protein